MMRCASARNMSAPMPLICSNAKSRRSYIQSMHERPPFGRRRQHGHQAHEVARKRRPQPGGDAADGLRPWTAAPRTRPAHAAADVHPLQHAGDHLDVLLAANTPIKKHGAGAPSMWISPPVIAPTIAQLPPRCSRPQSGAGAVQAWHPFDPDLRAADAEAPLWERNRRSCEID